MEDDVGGCVLHHSSDCFAVTFKNLRAARGMSYGQLAYITGLSRGYLCHLAAGRRSPPPDEVIERIATSLSVDPEHFVEYRLRRVVEALEGSPDLLSFVYAKLSDGELHRRAA